MKQSFARWRANFFTGLAVVLPAVVSLAVLSWVFGTVANITDVLLFFLPKSWTHQRLGEGPVFWYWSLVAFLLAVLIVTGVGRLARNYLGRKVIQLMDQMLSKVPLLNKIYGAVKQVNEAFSSSKKSSFKQVVLIEYPRAGSYSIGFITSEDVREASAKLGRNMVGVFVPTTPNPTGGFLLVVPEEDVIHLDMSVADGIKYIISLGAIAPGYPALDAGAAAAVRPSAELPRLPAGKPAP